LRKELPGVLGAEVTQKKAWVSPVPDLPALVATVQFQIAPIR
jgi:hypothetical protein